MYLVYEELGDGTRLSRCICSTPADAEEMCLAFTWESWFLRCFYDQHITTPKGFKTIYTKIPDSLLNVAYYNYEEVPYIA